MADIPKIKLAPSILSADFARLGEQVKEVTDAGADLIHVDIMDGHFVDGLTWGPKTIEDIKKWTHVPIEAHMMVSNPDKQIDAFVNAGTDIMTIHYEACSSLANTIASVKNSGIKMSLAINPDTDFSNIEGYLHLLDQVLVMTVHPGLPGQKFLDTSPDKISSVRKRIEEKCLNTELEVDGGINAETITKAAQSGASVLVAGSAIYDHPDGIHNAMKSLREKLASI